MSHQDDAHHRKNVSAVKSILKTAIPEGVGLFIRHGNAQREPWWLASVALTCWGWTSDGTLAQRVSKACAVVGSAFDCHETISRQGLLSALGTCGEELVRLMIESLANHIRSMRGYWSQHGKVNVAVDGTKFSAPRTESNQAFFSAAGQRGTADDPKKKEKKYQSASDQSKASTVQVLATVFWHLKSGLPLQWATSASNGSERRNAATMVDDLPSNARIIGDAEYVGYPLWSQIHNSGRTFLVRVGSNLTLLKQLGEHRIEDGYVSYWPEQVMRANKPPLVLRLIKIHKGKKAIYLVTNELDMDDKQARLLYSARWGIEIFFRTVKQTCQRAKLHCHTPENVLTELNWTLLGIWHALFAGKKVLLEDAQPSAEISPRKTINAFRDVIEQICRSVTPVMSFQNELAKAVLNDETNRTGSKRSRDYPRKKKHKRCGAPNLKSASKEQKQRLKQLLI